MALVSTTAHRLRLNKLNSSAAHQLPSRAQPEPSAQSLPAQGPSSTTHPPTNNPTNHVPSNPTSLRPARSARVQSGSKQPSSQIPLRARKPKQTSPSKPPARPRDSHTTPEKPPKSRHDFLREESKPFSARPPIWPGPGTPTIVLDHILLPLSPTDDPLMLKVSPRKRTQLHPIRPIAFNQSLHALSDCNQSSVAGQSDPDQTQELDVEPSVSNPSPATEPPVTSAGTNCEDAFLRPTSDSQPQSPHDRSLEHHRSSIHQPTGQILNGQPNLNTLSPNASPRALGSAHSPRPCGQAASSEQVSSPTQRKSSSVNTTSPAFLPSLHDRSSHLKATSPQPIDILDQQDSDSGSSHSTIMASRAVQQPRKEVNLISFSPSPAYTPKPARSPLKSATNTVFHDLPHDLFHNPPSPRSPRAPTDASTSSQLFNPFTTNQCATRLLPQPIAESSNPEPACHLQVRGAIRAARTSARFHSASPSIRRSRDTSVHSPLNPDGRPIARAPARASPSPSSSNRPSRVRSSPSVPDYPLEDLSQAASNQPLRSTASGSRRSSLNQHAYAITLLPDRLPSVSEGSASPSRPPAASRRPSDAVAKPATPPRPRVWDDENSFAAFQVEDSNLDVDLTITCSDEPADEQGPARARKRQRLSLGHVEMVMSDLERTMGQAGRRRSALRVRYSADGMGNRSLAEIEEGTDEDGERAAAGLGAGTDKDGGRQGRVLQDELLGQDQSRSKHACAAPSSPADNRDTPKSQPHSASRSTRSLSPVEERCADRLSESGQGTNHRADAGHPSHNSMTEDARQSECISERSADDSDQAGPSEHAAHLQRVKAEQVSDSELRLRDARCGQNDRDSEESSRRMAGSGDPDSCGHSEACSDTHFSRRSASASEQVGQSDSETRQDSCVQASRPTQPLQRDARLSVDDAGLHSPTRSAQGAGARRGTSLSSVAGRELSVAISVESQSVVEVGERVVPVIEISDSESELDDYLSDGHRAAPRESSSRASSRPGPGGFIRPSEEYASPAFEARQRESEELDAQSGSEEASREQVELGRGRRLPVPSRSSGGRSFRMSEEYTSPADEERRREAGDEAFYQQHTHPDGRDGGQSSGRARVRHLSASSRASSRMSTGQVLGQVLGASEELANQAMEERPRQSIDHAFDEQSVTEDEDSQDRQSDFTEDSAGQKGQHSEYDGRESEGASEQVGPRRMGSGSGSPVEMRVLTDPRHVPILIESSPVTEAHGHGESESDEERQVSRSEEDHSDREARGRGSDHQGRMTKSRMSEQDLSMACRPTGLERFKSRAMAHHLTSTPPGALPRPSPFPNLARPRRVPPRAMTPTGAPLVEISSADPKVAARVAALLKVHHGFVPHGCKAENAEAMNDEELEMEMEMSIQREEAYADRSRAHPGLLRAVQTRRGLLEDALTPDRTRDGSPASASRRSHRSLLEELEQLRYRPSRTRWSQMDWKILEACLRKAQRSRERDAGGGGAIEPGDVVLKMLGVLEMGIGDCEQEWEWSKMVHRVIALQKRRPSERGSASRASSSTPGFRARARDAARPAGTPGGGSRSETTYPSLEPLRRANSRACTPAQTVPAAPPMSVEFMRKASEHVDAYMSRKGKRRVGKGKIWEMIGKFEDRIEEARGVVMVVGGKGIKSGGKRVGEGGGGGGGDGGGSRGVKRVRSGCE